MKVTRAPIVLPAKGKHTATFILLHGLGDQGDGWSEISESFGAVLPHCKFIFPNAPKQRVTVNGGMPCPSWYDIVSLSDRDNAKEDAAGVTDARGYVEELVAAEAAAGVPSERVVVGGFSQGGAVALFTLRSDIKLAGIVGMSTYLMLKDATPLVSAANAETPVFMAHGTSDAVVQFSYGKASAERLQAAGVKLEFKSYKNMQHSSCEAELEDVARFLVKCLPAI